MEYYVQRKPSGYLGNAPIWWALNDSGYTAYLEKARRFSEADAMELTHEDKDKWAAYPWRQRQEGFGL